MRLRPFITATLLSVAATSSFAVDQTLTLTAGTTFFGASQTAGPINDIFRFTALAGNNFVSAVLTSINIGGLQDVTFTSVTLTTGGATVATFAPTMTGNIELRTLAATPMTAGQQYQIVVAGNVTGGSGSYSGTINVSPVPEPETYGLMLAGLAGVAFIAKRRARV